MVQVCERKQKKDDERVREGRYPTFIILDSSNLAEIQTRNIPNMSYTHRLNTKNA
jgi:hypothetical protein